jgi:hypothetical protein
MQRLSRILTFVGLFAGLAAPAIGQAPGDYGIGYASPEAALEALRGKPGVKITTQDGWTIAEDDAASTIWAFTPPGHAAHPGVVKRSLGPGKEIGVQTNVMCGASRTACDQLLAEVQALNDKMR